MKPPNCKLCQSPHWTYEEHKSTETEVPGYVKEMVAAIGGMNGVQRGELRESSREGSGEAGTESQKGTAKAASIRGSSPAIEGGIGGRTPEDSASVVGVKTCNACNKPLHNRGKVCNACRQRAYRERSK